jgi:hypothetical protein
MKKLTLQAKRNSQREMIKAESVKYYCGEGES